MELPPPACNSTSCWWFDAADRGEVADKLPGGQQRLWTGASAHPSWRTRPGGGGISFLPSSLVLSPARTQARTHTLPSPPVLLFLFFPGTCPSLCPCWGQPPGAVSGAKPGGSHHVQPRPHLINTLDEEGPSEIKTHQPSSPESSCFSPSPFFSIYPIAWHVRPGPPKWAVETAEQRTRVHRWPLKNSSSP